MKSRLICQYWLLFQLPHFTSTFSTCFLMRDEKRPSKGVCFSNSLIPLAPPLLSCCFRAMTRKWSGVFLGAALICAFGSHCGGNQRRKHQCFWFMSWRKVVTLSFFRLTQSLASKWKWQADGENNNFKSDEADMKSWEQQASFYQTSHPIVPDALKIPLMRKCHTEEKGHIHHQRKHKELCSDVTGNIWNLKK